MPAGRLLILAGIALFLLGVLITVLNRFNLPLGRLPGDLVWRGKSSTVYFPVVTSILLSVLASALLWFLNRRG